MLDSHCRESLTEGWARVWGRGRERGGGQGSPQGGEEVREGWGGCGGEGSQEGRGEVPLRQPLFQEPLSARGVGREGATRVWL